MIYLLLCIICSSLLVFMFKVFEHFGVEVYPAIVFNYITCVVCGLVCSSESPAQIVASSSHAQWLWLAVCMGVLFIHCFVLTGATALRFGVSTASVAMKLGLVIPVLLAFCVYHEQVTWYKVAGIICAVIAVALSSHKDETPHGPLTGWGLLLPVLVFVGNGLCDSGSQLGNKLYFPTGGADRFVLAIFFFAALTGIFYLSVRVMRGIIILSGKQVLGGIALGIPNYGSLLFLMKALDHVEGGSSLVFPVNNIAVVIGSTILSVAFFREHLNKYNRLGLVFAGLCILLMYFGKLEALLR